MSRVSGKAGIYFCLRLKTSLNVPNFYFNLSKEMTSLPVCDNKVRQRFVIFFYSCTQGVWPWLYLWLRPCLYHIQMNTSSTSIYSFLQQQQNNTKYCFNRKWKNSLIIKLPILNALIHTACDLCVVIPKVNVIKISFSYLNAHSTWPLFFDTTGQCN